MKYHNLGEYSSINAFVKYKLASLENSEASFDALFELMFSEGNNIIYEYTYGFDIKRVTYLESKNNVISLSRKIASLNLKPQSVIGIYLDNDLTWIETFWAILRSGHRPLLLNVRLDDTSLYEAMKETECELVISNHKKFETNYIFYKDLLKLEEKDIFNKFGEEILFMSSGTSENVKISAYTAKEIKGVLKQSAEIIQASKNVKRHYKGELKLLTFLPLYHIFGFIAVYTWFSFYSRTFVGLNDLSPQTIKNTILKHEVTHIFAVPLFWQKTYEAAIKGIKKRGEKTYNKFLKGMEIRRKLGNSSLGKLFSKVAFKEVREEMFKDSISIFISGGSVISKDVLSFFNSIGYELTSGYGMTEIGITSVDLSSNYNYLVDASIGKPLTGLSYKINEQNELLVKGDTLARYIISNHHKEYRKDGEYFNTHDLMEYKNGRYYFLGREDDLIIASNGENLNPNIIEDRVRLIDTPNLALILDDNKKVTLLVEVNKYITLDKLIDLDKRMKEKIKENNFATLISKTVYIKESFLKGDEFKINRKRLARDYINNRLLVASLSKEENQEIKDAVLDKVVNIIKDILVLDKVDVNKDIMLDLGANSLDYFAIASSIYDEFEVQIVDEASGVTLKNASDIANFIKEQL